MKMRKTYLSFRNAILRPVKMVARMARGLKRKPIPIVQEEEKGRGKNIRKEHIHVHNNRTLPQ